MSSIKKRILEYILLNGISKYKFYKETGITRGVLDSESGITEDNILKFINRYPDADINWLITGKEFSNKVANTKTYSKADEEIKDIIIRLLTVDDDIQKAFKFIIGKEINNFATQKLLGLIKDDKFYDIVSTYLKSLRESDNVG